MLGSTHDSQSTVLGNELDVLFTEKLFKGAACDSPGSKLRGRGSFWQFLQVLSISRLCEGKAAASLHAAPLWMDEILHHFESRGSHCLLVFVWESSFQVRPQYEPECNDVAIDTGLATRIELNTMLLRFCQQGKDVC